jgi:capsular polysaccharide biosynthesis protein
MELRTYIRALLRRWPLILVFALLSAGVSYGYASRAPRLYRATAQLSVTPSIVDFFTGEAVQRLLNNYALRLRSRAFAAEFAPRVGPGVGPDDVTGKVRAVAAPTEFRIGIEVDDVDPARAQQIANAAAFSFVERIRAETAGREKQDIFVHVLEQAELPGAPFSPRPRRDALGAALAGVLLGAVLAILLETWDDTVRTGDEARSLYGRPVLASIPSTHPKGILHVFSRRARR